MSEEKYKPTEEDIREAEEGMTPEQKTMSQERLIEARRYLAKIEDGIKETQQKIDNTNLAKGLYGPNNSNVNRFDQEWGQRYRDTLTALNHWKALLEEGL